MTTPSKADVLRVARECGFAGAGTNVFGITDKLERFAAAMYALGAAVGSDDLLQKILADMLADGWRQCAVGQHTSQFCGQLEVEKAKAYAKGAEDMRERAALACDEQADEPECQERAEYCADAIRALPITHTNTEGEQG